MGLKNGPTGREEIMGATKKPMASAD